ncbi:MAG: pyridoxal phosphate-dependent aminotransferase [bacterium]
MSFETADYLSWYVPRIRREDGALNLHASGVPALVPDELEVEGGNPWIQATAFEAELAGWLGCSVKELVFTPGATGGTLLALLTLAGSRVVVVESPIYEPMLRQAERLNPVRRLPRAAASGWRFDAADVADVVRDDTALILLTEPHNPSGALTPPGEILELAERAARHGALLLINEVYRGWTDQPSYHGAAPNIVVVSSLSKLFGAYWARLGWLSGERSLIERLRMAHLNFGMASAPNAAVGLAVLARADELLHAARTRAHEGLAMVDAWIAGTPGLSWRRPDGTGFGCVRLPPGTDDVALAERLHDEHGVLTVPGTLWDSPGTLRLSWLQASPDELRTALDRISKVL